VTFWDDLWSDGIMSLEYLRLHSFAMDPNISIKKIIQTDDWSMLFYLPLSPQAFQELMSMQLEIQMVPYDSNIPDSWNFSWGNSQDTSGRFYQLAFKRLVLPNNFKWVWKSKCTPKLKFFAWLILLDKLNTKDMLQRRNFHVQPNNHCVMCNSGVVEDLSHLFFEGPFEAVCWQKLGIVWDPTARASAFWCDFFH